MRSTASCVDVAVNHFVAHVVQLSSPRALSALGTCADDVGSVRHGRRLLPRLSRACRAAEVLVGLCLEIKKCKITVLRGPCTRALIANTHALLLEVSPAWADMGIAPFAEYLGLMMGPDVDQNIA